MKPIVLCADPNHPLALAVARHFEIESLLTHPAHDTGEQPVLIVQTTTAEPIRWVWNSRAVLEIAPWHVHLPNHQSATAVLRHQPLTSDLGSHDEAVRMQRLLLWPYGNQPVAWLADHDILPVIENWLDHPWQGVRWLEGPEEFTAEDTAAAMARALEAVCSQPKIFAARKFHACDRDGDGQLNAEEISNTLLTAGVSASEAGWALELIGRDRIDPELFSDGLDPALLAALNEQQTAVQVIGLEWTAAVSELLQHGWIESAAQAFHREYPVSPSDEHLVLQATTPLAEVLKSKVLDWIPIEIVPALGVISRRAGRIGGEPALLFTYRRRDGRVNLLDRSIDFRCIDLRDQTALAEEQERGEDKIITWSKDELERSLTLRDQRIIRLRVKGHWSDLHRAEKLLIRGETIPPWMAVLFRRSGEFQLQQELPRAPGDLICRCARVRCDRVAALLEQQPTLTLESLAHQTKATTICGGCIPMLESWLAVGGSLPPGSDATAQLQILADSDVLPVVAASAERLPIQDPLHEAQAFLEQAYSEQNLHDVLQPRLAEVETSLQRVGAYSHTYDELATGARLAWRNSTRCLGRHLWHELDVRDRRELETEAEMFEAIVDHIAAATNGGQLRSTITVFRPDGRRIWNPQFCRYAGYQQSDGSVLGDPMQLELTTALLAMGWDPGPRSRFDLLPIVIQLPGKEPRWFQLPKDLIVEVPIRHPEFSWFADLDLRWYALPAVSNMAFDCGGIQYTAAPFNGFYMGTEIGARNFGDTDRYDQLPRIAEQLGLDVSTERSLWRDRAVVELNRAVLYSYEQAGVRMADHHTLTRSFMEFTANEHQCSRHVQVDPRYVVPPISASLTPTFHATFDGDKILKPNFFLQPDPWLQSQERIHSGCPFHPTRAT